MYPTIGDDILKGSRLEDILDGLAGNDIIRASGGDDTVLGRSGDDKLYGNSGDDILQGGKGRDQLFGGSGIDMMFGGLGNDRLSGGRGNDVLEGGAGNDRLQGQSGDDTLRGGEGTDWAIYSGPIENFEIVLLPDGYLQITDKIGNEGRDTLSSIEKFRFDGKTILLEDVLSIATVKIDGASGNDRLRGSDANDIIRGRDGRDTLIGEDGNDTLYGGAGDDWLFGGYGRDSLYGGTGNDRLSTYNGNNILDGGPGTDTVYMNFYFDLSTTQLIRVEGLRGSSASDEIDLSGYETGFDVRGNTGNDRITSGMGNDRIEGGAGADSFIFGPNFGNDVVTDFTVGTDGIAISGLAADEITWTDGTRGAILKTLKLGDDGLPEGRVLFEGAWVGDIEDSVYFI